MERSTNGGLARY
ncbi:Protein of unknown function [Lactobacillus helveticus CIRM-BIA 101]|nr:Protein of unknown function [Lactobacillus helveticus CIRM-BIA 101]